jgi:hypothetical protein
MEEKLIHIARRVPSPWVGHYLVVLAYLTGNYMLV